jgi:hypothetical protein
MEYRRPKKTDQADTEKAFQILQEAMQSHSEIEPTMWAGAFWSCLVEGYANSGCSYAEFSCEWEKIKEHYISWFEK